jgi:hypothetical protein
MRNVNLAFKFAGLFATALLCQQPLSAKGEKVELIIRGEALRALEAGTSVHVHMNLDGVKPTHFETNAINNPFTNVDDFRIESRGDGKVDVDIIIRAENVNSNNQGTDTEVMVGVMDLDYITVDNISGVFETGSESNSNVQARIMKGDESKPNDFIEADLNFKAETVSYASLADELMVYPNPAVGGIFNIKISGMEIQGNIAVHNALGAIVAVIKPEFNNAVQEVKLTTLPEGVYYLRLTTNKGEQIRKFQIVNR